MVNFYIVNEESVASKIIDQEAIAINLVTGDYFSFSGCAPVIWKALMKGADLHRIMAMVQDGYEGLPPDVDQQISEFLGQLIAEKLVVAMPDDTILSTHQVDEPRRGSYEAPRIDKFDDMAMMLALDPPMPELPTNLAGRFSK